MKVEVEELESLLGPDDVDVDSRRILEEARDEKGCAIFETFSTHGPSELLVANCWRWDKHQRRLNAPWRQKCEGCGKRAWNSRALDGARWKKRVMENCANMNVDIEVLERLLVRENREVSLRYMLKYSRRGGSNIFQLFDTSEKRAHFVANRKRSLESQGMKATKQESWQNEWHDIECQGVTAKAPPCPERTLKMPLPQQSSPSSREEEGYWVGREDRRRRSIAFEKMSKRMMKYLEDIDDVKVGITELQERLERNEKVGVCIRQVAQQAMNDNGQHFSKSSGKEKKSYVLPVWPGGTHS